MNSVIKKTFEKIFLDKHLIVEFLELEGDKIFDFLKNHSESDFTKEEFEDSIVEIFETLYGEGVDLEKLSSENLNSIAGGKGSLKRGAALAMAMLNLGSGIPFIPGGLDFTPRASAFAFWKNKNFRIQKPFEMDSVIGYLRVDSHYVQKLQEVNAQANNAEAFRNWWRENGKSWWESNIMKSHAPEKQTDNILNILSNIERDGQTGQAAEVDPELAAVDRLLLYYFDCTAKENGISTNGLNNDVRALIETDSFKRTVDENFGTFSIVDQPIGFFGIPTGGAQRKYVRGHDRLMKLIMQRGSKQRQFDREVFISQMQRNAPTFMISSILFFGTSAISQVKDLMIQAGMWAKAGAIKTYNRLIYNRLTLERDPVKLKELMTEYLKSSVFRQDAAMDRIAEIMSGMTDLWAASDSSGKPCTSACTMTFMGDSGIGKTYAARTLSKALFHKDMQP